MATRRKQTGIGWPPEWAEARAEAIRRKFEHKHRLDSVCPTCGNDFVQPRTYMKVYCSRICANVRHDPARIADPRREAIRKMRRTVRCRERSLRRAFTWDGITDLEIFERDGWRCQLPECLYRSRKINQRYKYPDPRSPGVDHIVPLSLGGDDTCVNKRAAHHGCNMARGNRMGDEQLPLIGSLREPPLMTEIVGTVRERRKPEPKLPKLNQCPCGRDYLPSEGRRGPGRRAICEICYAELRDRARVMRYEDGLMWKQVSSELGLSGPGAAYTFVHGAKGAA